MKFTVEKNIVLENPATKSFFFFFFIQEKEEKLPLVIFAHGSNAYKDRSACNLFA